MLRQLFKKAQAALRFDVQSGGTEKFSPYKGEIFWELRDSASGALLDSGHIQNVVTIDASVLIARLMKGTASAHTSEPSFGALCLAIGTGDAGWNLQSPPAGTVSQRSLFTELCRKKFASANFINASGAISTIPTNVVDLTTVFSESEGVGPIVEMGLVGGDASSDMGVTNPILPANGSYDPTVDVTGKDMLINYVTFPVINKPATSTLSWTWRLTF